MLVKIVAAPEELTMSAETGSQVTDLVSTWVADSPSLEESPLKISTLGTPLDLEEGVEQMVVEKVGTDKVVQAGATPPLLELGDMTLSQGAGGPSAGVRQVVYGCALPHQEEEGLGGPDTGAQEQEEPGCCDEHAGHGEGPALGDGEEPGDDQGQD
jgi:hypothetical protein